MPCAVRLATGEWGTTPSRTGHADLDAIQLLMSCWLWGPQERPVAHYFTVLLKARCLVLPGCLWSLTGALRAMLQLFHVVVGEAPIVCSSCMLRPHQWCLNRAYQCSVCHHPDLQLTPAAHSCLPCYEPRVNSSLRRAMLAKVCHKLCCQLPLLLAGGCPDRPCRQA